MKVILFGATGMVGQGVLRECLLSPDVEAVLCVGRSPTGVTHARLREIVRKDLPFFTGIEAELRGYDACFFCLGVSAVGMPESAYERLTYGLTLAVAQVLVSLNPAMTFIYVSGAGTDSSASGPIMWARIKGRTENALLRLGFRAAYMFRPALILPAHGERSRTAWYRVLYRMTAPLTPLLRRLLPAWVVTTAEVGRAMIRVARSGAAKPILENRDIRAAGRAQPE